jgi:hypothetical protein
MRKKLAMFKNANGWISACEELFDTFDSYVRITEFVTVDFPDLPANDIVGKQLDMLSAKEAAAREQFQRILDVINDERGKLLALTNQGEPRNE